MPDLTYYKQNQWNEEEILNKYERNPMIGIISNSNDKLNIMTCKSIAR
jgi:hypothetical protein